MLVEREECSPEDHKLQNNLSPLLSFLLAETDGLESCWIPSAFAWNFAGYVFHEQINLLRPTDTGGDWFSSNFDRTQM